MTKKGTDVAEGKGKGSKGKGKSRAKNSDVAETISRDDIEAKFRELTGDVNDTTQRLTRGAVAVGSALAVLIVILVFLMGRSKGKKKTTVIEIVRV